MQQTVDMLEQILTPTYFANVLFTAIAFFTFIKLLSNEVYLSYHRLLPTIAGVIIIHDFYVIIVPFMKDPEPIQVLRMLCDMCAMVVIYMMFYYLLLLRKPKFYKQFMVGAIGIMVGFAAWNFVCYRLCYDYPMHAEIASEIVILVGSLYTEFFSKSKKRFEGEDKNTSKLMLTAFLIALVGYFLQIIFHDYYWIVACAYAIDSVIYYYMADSNRIEDTSVVMASTIFNSISEPMLIVNPYFNVVDVNNATDAFFPDGKNLEFAFENGDIKNKFILGQKLVERNENDKEYYAGKEWYRIHWNVVEGKKGAKGYIFSLINVTNQHLQVVEAKEETAEKSMFLAHMSHQLRSPLHAIIGVSDILLAKHDISTKNRSLVQHIRKASDGLLDLVDSILDFSKLEAGKFSFNEKKYSIEDVFEEVAYNSIVNLQSKPVEFSFAVVTEYPRYLYGDGMRVREIFQNLLSNAVKFTDSGSIHADVSFDEERDEMIHIHFSVRDTGIGMTPEQLKEVFHEYTSSADENVEGTGLGLSIVKKLVEMMGGHITAESDGVSGSALIGDFYQKLGDGEYLNQQVFNRRTVMSNMNNFSNAGMRPEWIYPNAKILVADDMKINQEILRQLLVPWKCQVVCVPDGIQAVAAAQEHKFDMILLDQMMSPMGGLEAADEIRKFSEVPIALVTANTDDNIQNTMAEHGINAFIGKPIHAQVVGQVLDEYMPAEYRQKNLEETSTNGPVRRDASGLSAYRKTLETFVKEMQPLLLHLPSYAKDDKDLFKIKVHGIKGVSRQIGREEFSDQAEIMEMAAKAEHWTYVDRHIDDFLNGLCDVVEDVTKELTDLMPEQSEPEAEVIEKKVKLTDLAKVEEVFEELLEAFNNFDITEIEQGINMLETMNLGKEETKVFSKVIDAYDELEYDAGVEVLSVYLNKNQ